MIDELRAQLLAPATKKIAPKKSDDDEPMPENKFKRVMDWGTPRLVTKNRALTLNQKSTEARSRLMTMVGINRGPKQEKKKQDFEMASVTNFRRRM